MSFARSSPAGGMFFGVSGLLLLLFIIIIIMLPGLLTGSVPHTPPVEELHADGYPSITSCDISPVALQRLQAKLSGLPGLSWVCCDMLAMPFPDAAFDVVLEKGTLDVLFVDDDRWAVIWCGGDPQGGGDAGCRWAVAGVVGTPRGEGILGVILLLS